MRLTRAYWTKPRGGAGLLAMAGLAAGMVAWWPIAVAAGGGWVTLAMLGIRRSGRAMAHLEKAFPDATRTQPGAVGDKLAGKIGEVPFAVSNTDKVTIFVWVGLPDSVTLKPTTSSLRRNYRRLGDPEFDARFVVFADDSNGELVLRLMLTAEIRAKLCKLFDGYSVGARDGWFEIIVDEDEADGPRIERLIKDTVVFGEQLWKQAASDAPLVTFVERIPREPIARIRSDHYAWLVEGGYEVPALLLLASMDPDPEIREWANSQRPSETLYR